MNKTNRYEIIENTFPVKFKTILRLISKGAPLKNAKNKTWSIHLNLLQFPKATMYWSNIEPTRVGEQENSQQWNLWKW